MAFHPFISKPNTQAIALSTVAYGLLYFVFIAMLKASMAPATLVNTDTGLWGNQLFMTIFGFAQYVVPGLLVGYLAEKSPMMHGYLLGIATTALVYTYASFAYSDTPAQLPTSYTVLYTCFVAGVWCSLGAVIADHLRTHKQEKK
ncbi:hypothetical protein [Undibacterium umbellatum]|jgi:hypothetical protein|uniref:Uncharacterized protein n=1 Tax=Undibacterium umbellatum TaxID=2762300 RepID=A0ABR6Z6N8_9BURK|nr:hypothetical protein [Undibacterium umbellatum]MBC3907428.1 hypothetical protein [Undibacterium umbellatum]